MDGDFIFVYGKLREAYSDKSLFGIDSLVTLPVETTGKLYEYQKNAVLIKDDNNKVFGNLLSASNMKKILRHTDSFMGFDEEDYPNSRYVRVVKKVFIPQTGDELKVWCYIFPSSRLELLEKEGKVIESGDWFQYLEEKKEDDLIKRKKKNV
ncbi:MAG: gamma-glutamylcyclotransferase family protein [Fusobacteriota bacterium]